jgi:uncharacterized protein (UPF0548 family)
VNRRGPIDDGNVNSTGGAVHLPRHAQGCRIRRLPRLVRRRRRHHNLAAGEVGCRVIYVVDEARRYGFAYGTLPGHPECGEEAFVVEHRPDDEVVFAISAFSRPADWLVRIGGPFVRRLQARATSSYLNAIGRLTVHD